MVSSILRIEQEELQNDWLRWFFWYQHKALVKLNKCESRLQNALRHNYCLV